MTLKFEILHYNVSVTNDIWQRIFGKMYNCNLIENTCERNKFSLHIFVAYFRPTFSLQPTIVKFYWVQIINCHFACGKKPCWQKMICTKTCNLLQFEIEPLEGQTFETTVSSLNSALRAHAYYTGKTFAANL